MTAGERRPGHVTHKAARKKKRPASLVPSVLMSRDDSVLVVFRRAHTKSPYGVLLLIFFVIFVSRKRCGSLIST